MTRLNIYYLFSDCVTLVTMRLHFRPWPWRYTA